MVIIPLVHATSLRSQLAAGYAGAGLAAIFTGALVATASWTVPAAALALVTLVILGIERPGIFLALVLLVRPLLDAASSKHVGLGFGAINVGGAIGLACLVVLVAYLLNTSGISMPPKSGRWLTIVAFSAVLVLLAYDTAGSLAGAKAAAEVVRLAAIVAVFVLAGNVAATPERVRRLFGVVALSAVIPALIAIIQYVLGTAPAATAIDIARPLGTFVGPNPLGEYLAVSALILISAPADFLKRSVRVVAMALVVGGLIITYSRSGYGELLIGLAVIEYRRFTPRMAWVAVVLVAVLVAVPSVRDRVLPTGNASAQSGLLAGGGTYSSLGWRFHNWSGLLRRSEERPILGFGLATTTEINPTRFTLQGKSSSEGYAAHSTPVRAVVEGGVVLLLLWLLAFWGLIQQSARAKNEPWALQPYARILWGVWVGIIITSVASDDVFSGTAQMYCCFALTGALQMAYRRRSAALRGSGEAVAEPTLGKRRVTTALQQQWRR